MALFRAMNISKKHLGSLHPNTLSIFNNIGALYYEQRNVEQAENIARNILNLRELALGPEHPDVVNSLCSLASLYQSEGRLQDAEIYYKRAEAINEKVFGSEHPHTKLVRQYLSELARQSKAKQAFRPLQIRSNKKRKHHHKKV